MTGQRQMQKSIEPLLKECDRLITERDKMIERLNGRIEGLNRAMELLQHGGDETALPAKAEKAARGSAKALLIDLLREVGPTGLNATMAEEIATKSGKVLKRATAASNLSRLKKDGVVKHEDDRYRLPEFSRQPGLVVVPSMAS